MQIRDAALVPVAPVLKLADNSHNSRLDRTISDPDAAAGMARRYKRARDILVPVVGVQIARLIYTVVNPGLLPELADI